MIGINPNPIMFIVLQHVSKNGHDTFFKIPFKIFSMNMTSKLECDKFICSVVYHKVNT